MSAHITGAWMYEREEDYKLLKVLIQTYYNELHAVR